MGMLDGKVAIVTGAGRGIGRGHARLLAAEGARVVVNDLDVECRDRVVDEIVAAGGDAVANHDDVATWAGAGTLVDHAVDQFGRLDILVNNAGILRDAMSFNITEDQWDSVIAVHLKGHSRRATTRRSTGARAARRAKTSRAASSTPRASRASTARPARSTTRPPRPASSA